MSDERLARSLPTDPKCPRCARAYARKYFKHGHQKPSFHCDPARPIGGCDERWDAK